MLEGIVNRTRCWAQITAAKFLDWMLRPEDTLQWELTDEVECAGEGSRTGRPSGTREMAEIGFPAALDFGSSHAGTDSHDETNCPASGGTPSLPEELHASPMRITIHTTRRRTT